MTEITRVKPLQEGLPSEDTYIYNNNIKYGIPAKKWICRRYRKSYGFPKEKCNSAKRHHIHTGLNGPHSTQTWPNWTWGIGNPRLQTATLQQHNPWSARQREQTYTQHPTKTPAQTQTNHNNREAEETLCGELGFVKNHESGRTRKHTPTMEMQYRKLHQNKHKPKQSGEKTSPDHAKNGTTELDRQKSFCPLVNKEYIHTIAY